MRYILTGSKGAEIRTASVFNAAQAVHMADTMIAGGYTVSAILNERGEEVRLQELAAEAIAHETREAPVRRDD